MVKVGQRICFLLILTLNLADLRLLNVGQAHLSVVKQEITEKCWLLKYIY